MSLALRKKYLMSLVQSGGGVSPRLPSAYQEVEWIGTSGTQYIDTGIKATLTSKIELDCQVKKVPTSNQIYYNGTNWFALGYEYENSKYYIDASISGAGTRWIEVLNSVYLARHTLILDTKNGQWGWDSTLNSYTPYGVDDTLNFYIGCRNKGSGFQQACDEYIYGFKYYENEVLVKQLIPCYRKADGEIGLYDLVNDVFYTNQGSGTFTCGVPIIYDSRYQQVEYIEGSGTQYIDTGIYQLNDKKIELSFKATTTNQTGLILGKYDNTTQRFGFDIESGYFVYTKHRLSGGWTNIQTADTNKHRIVFDNPNLTFIFDNTNYSMTNVIESTQRSLTLFAYNSSTIQELFTGQIFDVKIYESGTKVREFIPVYRRSDNEIGLLDIVNDVFYTNQGSGVFTKGKNIVIIDYDYTLENNSWDTIKAVIDNGIAPSSWLGQTKEITTGIFEGYHLQLVDLQANRYEKTDGTGYTNAVFMLQELVSTLYKYNNTRTNVGGFADSDIRATLNSTIKNALPSYIQSVISQCKVKSGTGNGTTSGTSSSDNYLFLACEYEILGGKYKSIGSTEGSPRYDYFSTADRRKKIPYGSTVNSGWLTRSPESATTNLVAIISAAGGSDNAWGDSSIGLAFAFTI